MSDVRLLVLEKNPAVAGRIASALQSDDVEPFQTGSLAEAKEALSLQQFDAILVSVAEGAPSMADELRSLAKRLTPPALVLAYGDGRKDEYDATIPSSLPLSKLSAEIKRLIRTASVNEEAVAAQLSPFDLDGFRQQMGEDIDLMREIITIFFEESAGQLKSLREALITKEFQPASRVAHSLKGSLGSLHAPRARHWAQTLELAAASGDGERYRQSFSALEQSLSDLEPKLQDLLKA